MQTATHEFTGRKMLAIMLAFFGVVIAVNVMMAVLARRSWTGLVVENSYVASQSFDTDTAALEKSAAMDIHAALSYEAGKISVAFKTQGGTPLQVKNAQLHLGHPVAAASDLSVGLQCSAPGLCSADVPLGPGPWLGEVRATLADNTQWRRAVKVTVGGH